MSRLLSLLLSAVLSLQACSRSDSPIPEGFSNGGALSEAIRRVVPPGISITDGQERMQASGFSCVYQWHAPLGQEQNQTYLYCRREEGTWTARRRWDVAIIMNGVTVGDVRVAEGTQEAP